MGLGKVVLADELVRLKDQGFSHFYMLATRVII